MDNIIEPNENFQFSKLSLTIPNGIQGGAYFTKIQFNNKPLYIQTTKSLTRQGIVKTGKKYYCDLMFDKNSEALIQWFENLEETCQKLIYSNVLLLHYEKEHPIRKKHQLIPEHQFLKVGVSYYFAVLFQSDNH